MNLKRLSHNKREQRVRQNDIEEQRELYEIDNGELETIKNMREFETEYE